MRSIETLRVSCKTCEITNRVIEQVYYENHEMAALIGYIYLTRQGVKNNTLALRGEGVVSPEVVARLRLGV
jgi:hypothetical protein